MNNLYQYFFISGIIISLLLSCKTFSIVDEVALKKSEDSACCIRISFLCQNMMTHEDRITLLDSSIYQGIPLFAGYRGVHMISHDDYLNHQKVLSEIISLEGIVFDDTNIEVTKYEMGKVVKTFKYINEKQIDEYLKYLKKSLRFHNFIFQNSERRYKMFIKGEK